MKKLSVFCSFVILASVGVVSDASARSEYRARLPSVSPQGQGCVTCHVNVNPDTMGRARNAFGQAFQNNGLRWSKALADLDSDNDTFSNGVELGDVTGTVIERKATFVSNPGQADSVPPVMNCGNDAVDNGEDCDGTMLNNKTCADLGQDFDGGTLSCKADCTFDTSACTTSMAMMDMAKDMTSIEDMSAPVDMTADKDMAVTTPDMTVGQDMGSSSQDMGTTPTPTTPKTQDDEGCSQSGKSGPANAGLGLLLLGFFGVLRRAKRRA